MRSDLSPPSSPARKRQRLSSPTYDEQLTDLSQEDLAAFDELEYRLSQSFELPAKITKPSAHPLSPIKIHTLKERNSLKLTDDSKNPINTRSATARDNASFPPSALPVPLQGFSRISTIQMGISHNVQDHERSPSPEEPWEQDFTSWFEPASVIPPVAFELASTSLTIPQAPVLLGFTKASNKGLVAPSSVALAKAQIKMDKIWREVDSENVAPRSDVSSSLDPLEETQDTYMPVSSIPLNLSPHRPAFRAVENSPGTPSPASFSRPTMDQNAPLSSPAADLFIKRNAKPFKSPLLSKKRLITNQSTSSPLNPASRSGKSAPLEFSTANSPYPFASTVHSTPGRPATVQLQRATLSKTRMIQPFVTPFKNTERPVHRQLEQAPGVLQQKRSVSTLQEEKKDDTRDKQSSGKKRTDRMGVFDLTQPSNRITLASSGLVPQKHTEGELESFGINIEQLSQLTPTLAIYYSFHSTTVSPLSPTLSLSPPIILGPAAALDQLLKNGCSLATKPWVDNHWCLILWKLAGMVALDPDLENTCNKRWCWAEVMRQLFYRYERELNRGNRPALRLLTTQDAPAGYPMNLCVSNIIWSTPGIADDGIPLELHPELEVTDGWYRLRSQVDAPLVRAIRRGIIRIGRKISVAGARLSSEKKDPSEVLEAYDSMKLVISGNSSHLAPWHAKLGFRASPGISTLHSLTADGGLVAVMDLVVVKVYPIAFFEFIQDEDGQKHRQGPRNESEEATVHEQWKRRWELEMSKLRLQLDKKWSRYEGYIGRLEGRAGSRFNPSEDDVPPDTIEDIFDELEDQMEASRVLGRLSVDEAGWLVRHIRYQIAKEKSNANEELESEMKHLCPPREVRSFRVLIMEDACTRRRPANRKVQMTVWDVLNLSLSEGAAAGTFETGQRYMVTNLVPTQQRSWMDCEPGSEVFLSTRRDSRWTPIKS